MSLPSTCEPGRAPDADVGACCRQCDAGHGVALPCTGSGPQNDTVCTACLHGVSYSGAVSHEETCQPCSHCPPNSKPVHSCNVTHNTKCECVRAFWYDGDKRECSRCTVCPPGHEAVRPCAPYQNSVCQPCPKGYFSDSSGFTTKCRPCNLCTRGQVLRTACTATSNTECVEAQILLNGVGGNTERPTSAVSGVNLFPVYCAVPAVILAVLICFVLFKRWRQFSNCKLPAKPMVQPAVVVGGKTVAIPTKKRDNLQGCARNELKPMLLTIDSPVSLLPKEVFDQIDDLLERKASQCDWIALAKGLGYSDQRIRTIVKDADSVRQSPSRKFLQDWSAQSNQTVRLLIDCLEKLQARDSLRLLGEYVDLSSTINSNQPCNGVHFV